MQLYEYTDLLFCTKSTLFHLLLIFWAELQRQASIEIGVGSRDKATSILSLPLSSPPPPACLLTQNWCKTALSLICISSLASNILSMPFSSVSSCLLTQNRCIPEWDNSKDSRLQVMSAASHYNWTCCGPVSATTLYLCFISLSESTYIHIFMPQCFISNGTAGVLYLCFVSDLFSATTPNLSTSQL